MSQLNQLANMRPNYMNTKKVYFTTVFQTWTGYGLTQYRIRNSMIINQWLPTWAAMAKHLHSCYIFCCIFKFVLTSQVQTATDTSGESEDNIICMYTWEHETSEKATAERHKMYPARTSWNKPFTKNLKYS